MGAVFCMCECRMPKKGTRQILDDDSNDDDDSWKYLLFAYFLLHLEQFSHQIIAGLLSAVIR